MPTDLFIWTCSCGALNGMSHEAQAVYRQTHGTFYCVHGHPRHYPAGKSAEQKLQEQLDAERLARQRAEQSVAREADYRREAEEQAKHERNRANGYKGHATRIAKRAKAGTCPCCNRTFQQLARHMATKHPQFTPMPPELAETAGTA